jgi:hypothetical protein
MACDGAWGYGGRAGTCEGRRRQPFIGTSPLFRSKEGGRRGPGQHGDARGALPADCAGGVRRGTCDGSDTRRRGRQGCSGRVRPRESQLGGAGRGRTIATPAACRRALAQECRRYPIYTSLTSVCSKFPIKTFKTLNTKVVGHL